MAFKCFLGVLLVCLAFEGIAGARTSKSFDKLYEVLRNYEGESKPTQVEKRSAADLCGASVGWEYLPWHVNPDSKGWCVNFGKNYVANTDGTAKTWCKEKGSGELAVVDTPFKIGIIAAILRERQNASASTYGYFVDGHWNSDNTNWQYKDGRVIKAADTHNYWYNSSEFVENSRNWKNEDGSSDTRSCIRLMSNADFMWSVSKCWNTGDTGHPLCQKIV